MIGWLQYLTLTSHAERTLGLAGLFAPVSSWVLASTPGAANTPQCSDRMQMAGAEMARTWGQCGVGGRALRASPSTALVSPMGLWAFGSSVTSLCSVLSFLFSPRQESSRLTCWGFFQ